MNTMQIHTESLKTVSVVIPCFNEEKTIRKCIETTIRCSRNDLLLEILVVDGGSDDDTLEILSEQQILLKSPVSWVTQCSSNYQTSTLTAS
jgi:glycosyltransferase involved in cell wall biosynthesis